MFSDEIKARFQNAEQLKMMEQNLLAFRQSYPKQFDHIFQIVTSKTTDPWPETYEVDPPGAFPEGSYPKILLILGFRDPRWAYKIFTDEKVKSEIQLKILIENSEEIVRRVFQHADSRGLFLDSRIELILCEPIHAIAPRLFNILKKNHISALMENIISCGADITVEGYYKQVIDAYGQAVAHVYHNYGRIDDSLEGVRATISNFDLIKNAGGIHELKDLYKNKAGLVIGAGPSLDNALDNIKKNRDNLVLIAVDAALKPLLAAGIEPDYVTAIERENLWQVAFYEGLPRLDRAELVCYPVVHSKVLSSYPGRIRIAYRNYSYYAAFETMAPRGITKSGGSAGHLALRLAYWMGLKKVGVVGCDACFETSEDLQSARSHCKNTAYPDWEQVKPVLEIIQKKSMTHGQHFFAETYAGTKALTNNTYQQWANEFGEDALELAYKPDVLTDKMLRVWGINYVPFEEWAKDLVPLKFKEAKRKTLVKQGTDALNEELKKACDGWLKRLEEHKVLMDKATTPTDILDVSVSFMSNFYGDNLFVSFIVQCAAKEVFELENAWNSLPYDLLSHSAERKTLLLNRIDLCKLVVLKLANILTTTGGDDVQILTS